MGWTLGMAQPTVDGTTTEQEILDAIRKQTVQAMGSKSGNSVPPCFSSCLWFLALLEFLPWLPSMMNSDLMGSSHPSVTLDINSKRPDGIPRHYEPLQLEAKWLIRIPVAHRDTGDENGCLPSEADSLEIDS
ncbi:hypothetical protein H671_2g7904 [Cricetulus griseus]|nr:hypothetical protein H671_2g7904 [Cricetulus griseus]